MTRNERELEIRKLRKKLRQIENLELLERDLSEEECLKVSRKKKVRDSLQLLLNEVQNQAGHVLEPKTRCVESFPTCSENLENSVEYSLESSVANSENDFDDSPQDSSLVASTSDTTEWNPQPVLVVDSVLMSEKNAEECSVITEVSDPETLQKPQKRDVSPSVHTDTSEVKRMKPQTSGEPQCTSSQPQDKSQKAKKKEKSSSDISSNKFQVTTCVGHNDLVVAVSTDGEVLLSGSRDTTVKYWDVKTGTEIHSFGGHTGSVSAVYLLNCLESQIFCSQCAVDCELPLDDQERIGISGSSDCTLKVWAPKSGQLIRSVYTFNPITCLQFISEDHLVILATGGGKLEMWDIYSGQNLCSQLAHNNHISCLQYSDRHVYTASVDGEIQVYTYTRKSLNCVYRSEDLKLRGGGAVLCRPVRSLVQCKGRIYFGDDGCSVKALDWSEGEVQKLKNHVTEFGSTDALGIQGLTLFCSGYDLDVGLGYINCRDVESGSYMCTLCDEMTGRIVCLSCARNSNNQLVLVTGGLELKIWTQVPSKTKLNTDTIHPIVIPEYRSAPAHSDVDSSGSSAESDQSDYEDSGHRSVLQRRRSHDSSQDSAGWRAWCHIL